jgi:hypothetical protein
MARPYQPSLLRLLHGGTALLVLGAWVSGLLVWLMADRRGLPESWHWLDALSGDWIDIHGTAGVVLLPVAVLFAAYALSLGKARLRRAANALPLAALALAIGSGKLMDEDWLREGVLDHPVYAVHLLAWALLILSLIAHLIGSMRLGGLPLLQSMFRADLRKQDLPGQWPDQIRRHFSR